MSALEELVRAAMGSGVACFTDKVRAGEVDSEQPISAVFGDFPKKFLDIRSDLVEEVCAEILGVS